MKLKEKEKSEGNWARQEKYGAAQIQWPLAQTLIVAFTKLEILHFVLEISQNPRRLESSSSYSHYQDG